MRFWLAFLIGRALRFCLRASGRGGTSLPGRAMLRIDPRYLQHAAARLKQGVIVITGTNGKTTTARMLDQLLRARGLRILRNAAGANLAHGLTTAFLAARGCEVAILEVDEATLPLVIGDLQPRALVVTNVFRDQLDRYGEVARTAALIGTAARALSDGATLVVNADDPLLQGLSTRNRPVHFGVREAPSGHDEIADVRHCPRCGHELFYASRHYAHLGHYRCKQCGFERPYAEVEALAVDFQGAKSTHVRMRAFHDVQEFSLPLPGLYNVYNALAAVAAAHAVDGQPDASTLSSFVPSFGRMESLRVRDRDVIVALVKNPVGFNEALRATLPAEGRATYLFLINDLDADGRDVSWLWDVDIELLQNRVQHALTGGRRAHDMAVRLKYAGVDSGRIEPVAGDVAAALTQALDEGEGPLFCFPTYTALLDLHRHLTSLGITRHFREG